MPGLRGVIDMLPQRRRIHKSGMDRVDANVVAHACALKCHGLAHHPDSALRGAIGGHAGDAFETSHRGDIDHGAAAGVCDDRDAMRSEEHTSELQSLMRLSYAVFCLKKNTTTPPSPTR